MAAFQQAKPESASARGNWCSQAQIFTDRHLSTQPPWESVGCQGRVAAAQGDGVAWPTRSLPELPGQLACCPMPGLLPACHQRDMCQGPNPAGTTSSHTGKWGVLPAPCPGTQPAPGTSTGRVGGDRTRSSLGACC